MEVLTDEQLIEAYLAGDEGALQSLIGRYIKPIYNFVYRYVGNGSDAKDITQDVFFRGWKNIKKFDRNRKFKAWIFAIAKHTSLNWIKKKKPSLFSEFEHGEQGTSLAESLIDPAPLLDELVARNDLFRRITVAMGKLNPSYRTVLALRYDNYFNFREIAESLGDSIHTVKSRHRRALAALKKMLVQ